MKRVIIIEGPDNIGKTTLAKELAKEFHGTVVHSAAPVKKGAAALKEQLGKLSIELAKLEDETGAELEIWDRSIIGEAVYGPLYRAGQYDHVMYFEALKELKLYDSKVLLIVMYADGFTFEKFEIKPKSDEAKLYQQASQTQKVATAFVDVATTLRLKHTAFVNCNNYERMDGRNEYIKKRVSAWMKRKPFTFTRTNDYSQTFFNAHQRLWVPTIGFTSNVWECEAFDDENCKIGEHQRSLQMLSGDNPTPIGGVGAAKKLRYIFVGESTGYNSSGGPQLGMPFYNGESGCVFQTALGSLKIFPTQYYLTNVVKCNPKDNKLGKTVTRDSRAELECVRCLEHEIKIKLKFNESAKVVAIGKVAAEELARLKIDCVMAYHPSYYLRIGRSDDFTTDLGKVLA